MLPASAWSSFPVIKLRGELDIAARPRLQEILEGTERLARVTFDVRRVRYMDARSLGYFVHLHDHMAREPFSKRAIRLIGVRPIVARLIRLVRLDEIFEVCELAASKPDAAHEAEF